MNFIETARQGFTEWKTENQTSLQILLVVALVVIAIVVGVKMKAAFAEQKNHEGPHFLHCGHPEGNDGTTWWQRNEGTATWVGFLTLMVAVSLVGLGFYLYDQGQI